MRPGTEWTISADIEVSRDGIRSCGERNPMIQVSIYLENELESQEMGR